MKQTVVGVMLLLVSTTLVDASLYVYRENLENGFGDWSWSATHIMNNSTEVYDGTRSILVAYNNAWEGLFLGHVPGVSTVGYDALVFVVAAYNDPVNASDIVVRLKDENQQDLNSVSLFSYVPYSQAQGGAFLNPFEHRLVVIPLQWLNAVDKMIGGIMVMSAQGNTTLTIDNMKFAHVGLSAPGMLLSDGLGLTVVNESWTANHDAYWQPQPLTTPLAIPHQGDAALYARYVGQWEAVKLRATGSISTVDKDYLTFYILRVDAATNFFNLQVQLKGVGDADLGVPVTVGAYHPPYYIAPNEWIPIIIPLDDFLQSFTAIESVVIIATASDVGVIFLDDMSVTKHAFTSPLPVQRSWLLTTEVGDRGCTASSPPLPSHTGNNWYALDFNDISAVSVQESDVPVFAVADGTVMVAAFASGNPSNGNHVVINHGDGFESRSLHLKHFPLVSTGSSVTRGQPIGVLGATGTGGTHLHIGFRHNGSGSQNTTQLDLVRLMGLPLKSYKSECVIGTTGYQNAIRYYPRPQ